MNPIKLESKRLHIHTTRKEDTDFCLDIWLDDEMGQYMSDPPRDKADDTYLEWKETIEVFEGCYYFVSFCKETGKRIGTCSTVPDEESKNWDLGYSIHKDYWQQGYATEMIDRLIQFCKEGGAESVTASVAKANPGSNAVLKKLGFYPESEGHFKKCGTDLVFEKYIYKKMI